MAELKNLNEILDKIKEKFQRQYMLDSEYKIFWDLIDVIKILNDRIDIETK